MLKRHRGKLPHKKNGIWTFAAPWKVGTIDWFQTGKEVRQGCILSPCLFNLYAEYITRNAGLEEAQAGIQIAGRNINNLRYADDVLIQSGTIIQCKMALNALK